jgi:hypothetical protein
VQRLTRSPPISPDPYSPRDTQDSVVVNLLREHLDTFIEQTQADGGRGVPAFVVRQLRAMIDCGDLTRGFVRLEFRSCRKGRPDRRSLKITTEWPLVLARSDF